MHRSKLTQILIDVPQDRWEGALEFWCAALGAEPDPRDQPGDRYLNLVAEHLGLRVMLQRVEWEPSYHLDIESDDVEREAARLEALGAIRKRKVDTWWVMQAPTGHDFCVIRPQNGFGPGTVEWPRPGRRGSSPGAGGPGWTTIGGISTLGHWR